MRTTTAIVDRIATDPDPPPLRPLFCFSFAAYSKAVSARLRHPCRPRPMRLRVLRHRVRLRLRVQPPPPRHPLHPPRRPPVRSRLPKLAVRLATAAAAPPPPPCSRPSSPDFHGILAPIVGPRQRDHIVAAATARSSLSRARAPSLVPVYRNFYIPATPVLAGNPVFYVRGANVRLAGIDLADFFRREQPRGWASGMPAPAWAATSARRVDVWTELAEWCSSTYRESSGSAWEARVERQIEEAGRRLKEAGWREEEVGEMVAAGSSSVDGDVIWTSDTEKPSVVLRHRGDVLRQLRLLSLALLRGGWSPPDDVVESMGWTTWPRKEERFKLGLGRDISTGRTSTRSK